MLPLLLLPLLWGGSLQQDEGFELQVPERVTVQEGLCVLVPCTFLYPWNSAWDSPPLDISWFRSGDRIPYDPAVVTNSPHRWVKTDTQGRFHLLGNSMTNSCTLRISDAKKRDAGTYIFHLERGDNVKHTYQEKTLNVQVTDLTEKPSIHIPEPLQSGHPTKLTCSLPGSCERGTPLTFSWKGDALKLLDPKTLQSPVLTITPRPQDQGTYLTCQVTLQRSQVTMETNIQLSISYAPGNVSISISQNGADSPLCCPCFTMVDEGSGPLVRTLIRGALMAAGFLLTYGLTWLYYSRCGSPQRSTAEPPSFSRKD